MNIPDTTAVHGKKIRLRRNRDRPCPSCGSRDVIAGPGRAMHAAGLRCIECNRHRGWMSGNLATVLVEATKKFGLLEITVKGAENIDAFLSADASMPFISAQNGGLIVANIDEKCPSGAKYLKAADIDGILRAKIIGVDFVEFEEKEKNGSGGKVKKLKCVLTLSSTEKQLVLNDTNKGILKGACGAETDDWIGRTLDLFVVQTQMGPGIQIRVVKNPPSTKGRPDPNPDPLGPPDEEASF